MSSAAHVFRLLAQFGGHGRHQSGNVSLIKLSEFLTWKVRHQGRANIRLRDLIRWPGFNLQTLSGRSSIKKLHRERRIAIPTSSMRVDFLYGETYNGEADHKLPKCVLDSVKSTYAHANTQNTTLGQSKKFLCWPKPERYPQATQLSTYTLVFPKFLGFLEDATIPSDA